MSAATQIDTTSAVARRSRLDQRAKDAYAIYAEHTGLRAAFEQLPNQDLTAWREIVKFFENDPACPQCEDELFCTMCHAKQIGARVASALERLRP